MNTAIERSCKCGIKFVSAASFSSLKSEVSRFARREIISRKLGIVKIDAAHQVK